MEKVPVRMIKFISPEQLFSTKDLAWRVTTREEMNRINSERADGEIVLYDHHSEVVGAGIEHNEFRGQVIPTERVGLWISYLIYCQGWMLELLKVIDEFGDETRSLQLKYQYLETDTSGMIEGEDLFRVLANLEKKLYHNIRGIYENEQGGTKSATLILGPNLEKSEEETSLSARLMNNSVYINL